MASRWHEMMNSLGLLILRLGAGACMVSHGWGKWQMLVSGGDFADPLGIGGKLSLVLIMFAEFVCAILVMAGFFTRLASIPIVIGMAVIVFKVHWMDPWGKKELPLVYLAAFLALVFTGPGKISVDNLIWPWWQRRKTASAPNSVTAP